MNQFTDLLLSEYRIDERLFTIGIMDVRVTVYKQQVRALNLLYGLRETNVVTPPDEEIAVIGGGFAGVTAAAAGAALGYKVWLFEQRPILCHLQHGCDTRWIHPHLYDWPTLGSDNPHAGLPLLNWTAGTAADVTEQIIAGYNRIKETTGRIHEHLGASTKLVGNDRVQWDNSQGAQRAGNKVFKAVILAVGFGIERGVGDGRTPSYWRNDSLNQPEPGTLSERRSVIFVSGTGDGGLIDLLRSRISGFNHGRILHDLFPPSAESCTGHQLIGSLREIAKEPRSRQSDGWLFDQYKQLSDAGLTEDFCKQLSKRLRQDTTAILNGTAPTFVQALRLDRASLFNTFVAYHLYQLRAFSYVTGKCAVDGNQVVVNDEKPYAVDSIILRHGTSRRDVLLRAGLSETTIEQVEKVPELVRGDTSRPFWPGGWWKQILKDTPAPSDYVYAIPQHWGEFIAATSITIATTFVRTLATCLKDVGDSDARFRIVLHRSVKIQDQDMFQQASFYAGTSESGPPGRVFDANVGATGLACRLRRPLVIRRTDDFDAILQYLQLNPEIASQPQIQSWFVCPLFAPAKDAASRRVLLALFLEADRDDFCTDRVLKTIYHACSDFRNNLDELSKSETLWYASSEYLGLDTSERASQVEADQEFARNHASVEFKDSVFEGYEEKLMFQRINSFTLDFSSPLYRSSPTDRT